VSLQDNPNIDGEPQASINSVVLEQDIDFGDVQTVPLEISNVLPSQRIEPAAIAHLTVAQQNQLLCCIGPISGMFLGKTRLCTLVEHKIIMSLNFVLKRARVYKIPKSLKGEIATLLSDGFIRYSSSLQASPIVCVLKKTKVTQDTALNENQSATVIEPEVRLAIVFRYLNSFPQAFPFPVPDQQNALDAN